MSTGFVPCQTRLVAFIKKIVIADKGGKRVVQIAMEIDLPNWVNVNTLAPLQGQLADVHMEAVKVEHATQLTLDQLAEDRILASMSGRR